MALLELTLQGRVSGAHNLAHELGHAHYGDTPTGNGHYDQRQETRAWAYAANLLISPVDFAAKAALFDGPQAASAAVICVDDDWGKRMAQRAPAGSEPREW